MKNLKKVLAMVLAFACTFTMFASAKVYEDVQPGSEFSEAITMLSDLGIIQGKTDGKYHPEETITRAEACALIARLLTGDPNVSNFGGAQNFTDVVKGSWQDSAIGYCVANGITVGVGNGKFEPNRAINDQEFLTMMVRALGYETPDVKQGYPFSYMTVANAIGLRQDTEMMANTDALRGEDAQVIYNAMFVDYAKGAKMINTTHGTSVEKYPTLAESVWGLDRAALGTFSGKEDDEVTLTNCKAHTWVIVGADKKAEGRVLAYPIDDDTTDIYESDVKAVNGTKHVPYSFKYEGDADALKGYQVELWGEGKHGTPTWEKGEGKFVYSDEWNIKAIKTVKGQTKYDYDASKADAKSDNDTIELGESKLDLGSVADNAKKVSAKNTTETTQTTYLSSEKYNGESVDKDKNVEKALNIRDGAQYKLMDWDSDGNIDWIVVDEANYFKVESANSKRLTVTSMKSSTKDGDEETQTGAETQTWKLDGLNDEKNYKVKFVAPEDVKEGDILEVTYKTAYDKGEKCEVVTATATVVDAENQELDKVSTKSNLVLTFNGETKQLAQNNDKADTIVPANPTKYIDFDEEELGTEFALYMNRNGFIVYSDYATESSNYMMVLDTDNGEDGARPKLGALKILTSDNKVEKNVEVVSDLRINGKTSGEGYEKSRHAFDETKVVGNVYKYWKDADGRVTKMESVIDASKADNKADEYEYVSKNDRLTLKNKGSYALKDAKVIFAVKPHNGMDDYIQYDRPGIDALFVDEDDVLAVKAADIPDIGDDKDTLTHTLDHNASTTSRKSWINDTTAKVAIDADGNKDINAAVLGVNNFNKFNAGSTKVGLVTNVSYDKNDVVSIDVATNGKVETLSSVEKTSFDDVVSVLDYTNKTTTKSYSVGSRTEEIKNGLMAGSTLKDYLNKNGAYAEITTNADGKLTGVLFMDEKKGNTPGLDGDANGVNEGNVVVGDYYQVSRKVVADVKEGSWMSVIEGSAIYADEDNFKSMDTKNKQKAADFTSDATYYLIDGKPTKHGNVAYAGSKASVLDGFDGNPDIKVAEASDVRKSDIRNDGDSANDIYNVADVASKIDDNGAGDIVAVYMYDDDMGEKIGLKGGATVAITGGSVVVGNQTEISVTLPTDDKNLGDDAYVEVVKTENNKETVVVSKVVVKNGEKYNLDTSKLAVGDYTIKLYGYNVSDKTYEVLKEEKLTIKDKAAATTVEFVDVNGKPVAKPDVNAKTLFFQVKDADGVVVKEIDTKQVEVYRNNVQETDAVVAKSTNSSNGVYTITLKTPVGNDRIHVRYGAATGEQELTASVTVEPTSYEATQNVAINNEKVQVSLSNADKAALKIWTEGQTYEQGAATQTVQKVQATLAGTEITLSGTPDTVATAKFFVGISDAVKAELTVNIVAPKLSSTVASGKTAGVAKVDAVKATATYPITKKNDGAFKMKIGESGAETDEITAETNNDTTASNAKTKLEAKYGSEYDFSVSANKITITAKTAKAAQEIPALIVSTAPEKVTVETVENQKTGVEAVVAQAGSVKFKIAGTATKDDAGTWVVTVGSKTVNVTVAENDTPNKIAKAIETAFSGNPDLEASVSADTVTITEKSTKEGTVCTGDFTATFAKQA